MQGSKKDQNFSRFRPTSPSREVSAEAVDQRTPMQPPSRLSPWPRRDWFRCRCFRLGHSLAPSRPWQSSFQRIRQTEPLPRHLSTNDFLRKWGEDWNGFPGGIIAENRESAASKFGRNFWGTSSISSDEKLAALAPNLSRDWNFFLVESVTENRRTTRTWRSAENFGNPCSAFEWRSSSCRTRCAPRGWTAPGRASESIDIADVSRNGTDKREKVLFRRLRSTAERRVATFDGDKKIDNSNIVKQSNRSQLRLNSLK